MADVEIIKTPLRYFITVDQHNIPVSYQREFQQRVEQGGVELAPPQVKVEDINAGDFRVVFDNANVALTGTVTALNARIAELIKANEALTAERDAAINAINAVKSADAAWEQHVRPAVDKALGQ